MKRLESPSNVSTLPPLYTGWMEELLEAPIPEETEATCLDCAMCVSKNVQRTEEDHIFNSKTKCCTYIPKIPNFLTGRILADEDPVAARGRRAFEAYFRNGAVVRPHGVSPHHDFTLHYRQDVNLFGRNEDLRCPYYLEEEGGLCGIWRHRNSTCSTWFCKHVRGDLGRIFWKAMDDLLATVQQGLTHWCLHQLQAGTEDFRQWFPISSAETPAIRFQQQMYYYKSSLAAKMQTPDVFQNLLEWSWGKWLNHEVEFFKKCAALVNGLTWDDVVTIAGSEVVELADQTRKAFGTLASQAVPQNLVRGVFRKISLNESMVRVWGYAAYDPIDLPRSVVEVLPYFDGRSTEEVFLRIESEKGVQLSTEMLRKLIDFGILRVCIAGLRPA